MPSIEDRNILKDGLHEYFMGWETEVQPALGEVQLLSMGGCRLPICGLASAS